MSTHRIDDIIASTFADQRLLKKAKQAKQSQDYSEASKVIQHSADSGTQPRMSTSPGDPPAKPTRNQRRLDRLQLALDVVGIADPTPAVDGANAAISVARAVAEPERAGHHLENAAISAVSMVPYIGDLAKLRKAPRAARAAKGSDAVETAASTAKSQQRSRIDDIIQGFAGGGGSGNGGSDPPRHRDNSGDDGRRDDGSNGEAPRVFDTWTKRLKTSGQILLNLAGPVGKLVGATAGAVSTLKLFNDGVIAVNRGLSAYNGELSVAYAQYDAHEIRRKMREGDAVSDSLKDLIKQQSALNDHIDRYMNPAKSIGYRIESSLTGVATHMLNTLELVSGMNGVLDQLNERDRQRALSANTSAWHFLRDISDGKLDGKRPTLELGSEQILPDRDHKEVFGS